MERGEAGSGERWMFFIRREKLTLWELSLHCSNNFNCGGMCRICHQFLLWIFFDKNCLFLMNGFEYYERFCCLDGLLAKHQEWTEKGAERCQLLGNVEKLLSIDLIWLVFQFKQAHSVDSIVWVSTGHRHIFSNTV